MDRQENELLEKAAIRLGYRVLSRTPKFYGSDFGCLDVQLPDGTIRSWNPLTQAGDLYGMARDLGMVLDFSGAVGTAKLFSPAQQAWLSCRFSKKDTYQQARLMLELSISAIDASGLAEAID